MFTNSDAWWDTTGPARMLHRLTDLRLQFMSGLIDIRQKHILDIGCGGGIFSEAMYQQGAQVTGVDVCKAALHAAKTHAAEQFYDIQYIHAHEKHTLHPKSFDVVVMMEVLEHVPCVFQTLSEWLPYLKPGGYVIGSTLNRTQRSYFKAIVLAEHVLGWIPKGTHSWHAFITPQELKEMCMNLECAGWVTQGYRYSLINTPAWCFSSSQDTNFFFATRKSPDAFC